MLITILPQKIVDSISSEDELLDLSAGESIYVIRALKAAVELNAKVVNVDKINEAGQVYLESHQIWINADSWVEV
jgi:hypothetical protein